MVAKTYAKAYPEGKTTGLTHILYTQTIRKNHPPNPKSVYLDGTRLSLEPLQADGFKGLARWGSPGLGSLV